MIEADLYAPLKSYLEGQGYIVKGEVNHCDVVARRGEELVVVELKLSFNMTSLLQAVDRLSLTEIVYIGVPYHLPILRKKRKQVTKMLRLMGLGLIAIDPTNKIAPVAVIVDPVSYQPRPNKKRQAKLLGEFEGRVGDPNAGGSVSAKGTITVYRQRALKIANYLSDNGATKAADLAKAIGDEKARDLVYKDVYGWFERLGKGVYRLSPKGAGEFSEWQGRTKF